MKPGEIYQHSLAPERQVLILPDAEGEINRRIYVKVKYVSTTQPVNKGIVTFLRRESIARMYHKINGKPDWRC